MTSNVKELVLVDDINIYNLSLDYNNTNEVLGFTSYRSNINYPLGSLSSQELNQASSLNTFTVDFTNSISYIAVDSPNDSYDRFSALEINNIVPSKYANYNATILLLINDELQMEIPKYPGSRRGSYGLYCTTNIGNLYINGYGYGKSEYTAYRSYITQLCTIMTNCYNNNETMKIQFTLKIPE